MSRDKKTVTDRVRLGPESIVLGMALLGPWAIGAVDAWAQLILEGGLVLLAILGLLTADRSSWARRLFCVPSLALGALALLALVQAWPLPAAVLKTIAPATSAWRAKLAPAVPRSVVGDAGSPVAPPARTLSHDPDASLRTAAQLAAAWLLFQGVLGLGRGARPLHRFALATVANGCLLTLFSIAQALAWNGKIYGVRPTLTSDRWMSGGPFVSHNHLAAYLNLAFGFALGFLLMSARKGPGQRPPNASRAEQRSALLWAASAAGLIFTGLLASQSRGGFLAAVISAAIMMIFLRPRSVRPGVGLGVIVVVAALFLIVMGSTSPFERLATIKDAARTGLNGRFQVWGVALRAWRSFPIWGVGLGSFPAATGAYYREQFFDRYFSHAESEYLHMLAEGGILGAGLALVALASMVQLGRRARDAATSPGERGLILGALAGGLALLIQCLSDFPLHIPGVAVSAVVLAAHLCRLGLEAREDQREPAVAVEDTRPARVGPWLAGVAMVGLSVAILALGIRLARVEALVRGVGLPFPGSVMPSVDAMPTDGEELNRMRVALEQALRLRPDWAEGHLRLGATLLGLYSDLAATYLGEVREAKDPEAAAVLCDPLWLHRVVHSATAEDLAAAGGVLDHEPVRRYLIPATRCFLEARRSSPDLALSHARLAELDYLVEHGEPTSVHAARALRLTGYDHLVLALAGNAAAQAGDLDLAACCWKKALTTQGPEAPWAEIVLAASMVLTPEQILQQVLPPGGRHPLQVADLLYSAPEWAEVRGRFLKAALERLRDDNLPPIERTWVEAQIRARLGEREPAQALMTGVLVDEPLHPEWREELIDWLITWGDVEEASRQARIGLTLHPDDPGIQRASQATLDALARGNEPAASAR